jgi:hypothetical protein
MGPTWRLAKSVFVRTLLTERITRLEAQLAAPDRTAEQQNASRELLERTRARLVEVDREIATLRPEAAAEAAAERASP